MTSSIMASGGAWALGRGIYEGRGRSFRHDQEMFGSRQKKRPPTICFRHGEYEKIEHFPMENTKKSKIFSDSSFSRKGGGRAA